MSACVKARELLMDYGIPNFIGNNFTNSTDSVFQHWCHFNSIPPHSHYFVGMLLVIICVCSIVGNTLVIVVFSKYRRLRSPANTLIVNLAVSDAFNGTLHPMAAYSSFMETWMFGRIGCEVYASLCGLFGLVSIVTLTAIAVERCLVISVKPWYGGILLTNIKAKFAIVLIWLYSAIMIIPPFMSWGAFVPEGFLTSCSFDYLSRTPSNRSYFIFLFTLGFVIPVTVISVCYSFIIHTIFVNERDMKKNNIKKTYQGPRRRNDFKAAEMIMFVIVMFLVSWTPYSIIATLGQFGDTRVLTPWVSMLPSLFAKMSTIYNPVIYGLSHRHFRATLRRLFSQWCRAGSNEKFGNRVLSRNTTITRSKNGCPCLPIHGITEGMDGDSSSSCSGRNLYIGVTNKPSKNRVVYFRGSGRCVRKESCDLRRPKTGKDSDDILGHHGNLVLTKNRSNSSLFKSLMFKSESSIYQKYQTYFEKDHIVKLPTVVYFYDCKPVKTKSKSLSNRIENCGLPVQSSCLRVMNLHSLSISELSSSGGSSDSQARVYGCPECHRHLFRANLYKEKA